MSEHARETGESDDRERVERGRSGARRRGHARERHVDRGGRAPAPADTPLAAPTRGPAAPRGAGELVTYYRLRCIALEAALERLEERLERERRQFDEVVERYEDVLQQRETEGAVTVSRRR